MLWHQSLKSIHYRTLLIFLNKKTTDLRVKTWGNKRHVSPPSPCSNMGGGIHHPHPPRIYALAYKNIAKGRSTTHFQSYRSKIHLRTKKILAI